MGVYDHHGVGVVAEAHPGCGHVVGHDQVDPLGDQLGSRILQEIGGLSGEPDQHLAPGSLPPKFGQDVGGGYESYLGDTLSLFDLLGSYVGRTKVRYRGGHEHDVSVGGPIGDHSGHLLGGLYRGDRYADHVRCRIGSGGNTMDLRSARGCLDG